MRAFKTSRSNLLAKAVSTKVTQLTLLQSAFLSL